MALDDEIREQPEVLRRLLGSQRAQAEAIAAAVRRRPPRFVYLAGRGTSDNSCRYAQYVLGRRHRLPVALAAPSLFSLYGSPPDLAEGLVIGVSQSGRSPDMVAVVEEGVRQGATTVAITNSPDSPIGRAAELVLDTCAGPELSVAATKTYTSQLFAVAMLSAALSASETAWRELAEVAGAIERGFANEEAIAGLAARHRSLEHCVVIGRGYNYATAHEWSLKLKELASVAAEAYSHSDLQHGPIAVLRERSDVLAILALGAVFEDGRQLVEKLRRVHKARLTILSNSIAGLEAGDESLPFADGTPEWLSAIAAIVPAQLFCLHLARAKGLSTESPRGLSKVTCTW